MAIIQCMMYLFHTSENVQTRLWTQYTERPFKLLNNFETTVQDSLLFHDQLIIDKQKSDGNWKQLTLGKFSIGLTDRISKITSNKSYQIVLSIFQKT